jgi:hypothetical protein
MTPPVDSDFMMRLKKYRAWIEDVLRDFESLDPDVQEATAHQVLQATRELIEGAARLRPHPDQVDALEHQVVSAGGVLEYMRQARARNTKSDFERES